MLANHKSISISESSVTLLFLYSDNIRGYGDEIIRISR
jgi:hypothetical protein